MLLGREPEQEQLDLLLRRARSGISGVLVLRGEPGIGKTTLLRYAASQADGMSVLWATGVESEAGLPFAGLYTLLRPVLEHIPALPAQHAAGLRAALGLDPGTAAPERLAVAAGTHGLLSAVAGYRPLLVLVDDPHWFDPATTDARLFAVRRFGADAVACVLTMHRGPPPVADLPVRDVTGLARPEVERLVEAVAGRRAVPEVTDRAARRVRWQPARSGRAVSCVDGTAIGRGRTAGGSAAAGGPASGSGSPPASADSTRRQRRRCWWRRRSAGARPPT